MHGGFVGHFGPPSRSAPARLSWVWVLVCILVLLSLVTTGGGFEEASTREAHRAWATQGQQANPEVGPFAGLAGEGPPTGGGGISQRLEGALQHRDPWDNGYDAREIEWRKGRGGEGGAFPTLHSPPPKGALPGTGVKGLISFGGGGRGSAGWPRNGVDPSGEPSFERLSRVSARGSGAEGGSGGRSPTLYISSRDGASRASRGEGTEGQMQRGGVLDGQEGLADDIIAGGWPLGSGGTAGRPRRVGVDPAGERLPQRSGRALLQTCSGTNPGQLDTCLTQSMRLDLDGAGGLTTAQVTSIYDAIIADGGSIEDFIIALATIETYLEDPNSALNQAGLASPYETVGTLLESSATSGSFSLASLQSLTTTLSDPTSLDNLLNSPAPTPAPTFAPPPPPSPPPPPP
eukprot:CAMPEP_0182908776 /NCGR_PEP_ID=MMETSP0034_2-20130328/35386_1 /TAXON_ID=156128 /ORGANISM="Nephroselmis pyriformis, Strain CCMP717" /LENGTH=403 /DNA_ID=CAMNT_0025044973 /DNA_START=111 /DNA_END=1318 /DNA_ORIENTATION=+